MGKCKWRNPSGAIIFVEALKPFLAKVHVLAANPKDNPDLSCVHLFYNVAPLSLFLINGLQRKSRIIKCQFCPGQGKFGCSPEVFKIFTFIYEIGQCKIFYGTCHLRAKLVHITALKFNPSRSGPATHQRTPKLLFPGSYWCHRT